MENEFEKWWSNFEGCYSEDNSEIVKEACRSAWICGALNVERRILESTRLFIKNSEKKEEE